MNTRSGSTRSTNPTSRNLFRHHLSRRPASANSTTTSASTLQQSPEDNSNEIADRDRNGNYTVEVPEIPVTGEDEQLQQNEAENEKEKLEAKLVELYRNRARQLSEPAELLDAIQISLKNKVESLEQDRWMFEAENDPPI
ncbi:MAG: hypothetical protein M1834_000331 [Cirrosporium novae-zelandiae]|nr:MAG: hypothetical protein M1834_000331 [Cirrosporium novae-zelandiae]